MIEPTDGEAADPWTSFADGLSGSMMFSPEHIQGCMEAEDADTGFIRWRPWSVLRHDNFLPEFVPFPRVAAVQNAVEQVRARVTAPFLRGSDQRAALDEARRRVNIAVDVLRYGDTGDW